MENIALVTIKVPQAPPRKPARPSKPQQTPVKMIALSIASSATAARQYMTPSKQGRTTVQEPRDRKPPTLGVKIMSAGLAACWADLMTFPLDTAKVRLQIQGEGPVAASAVRGGAQAVTNAAAVSVAAAGAGAEAVKTSLKYRGILGTLITISKEEGPRALYNGLTPGLQRQMAFASIRIGLYDNVKQAYIDFFKANGTVSNNNVGLRILAGITTGAMAVTCAQPTDVVKVRMQAAGSGPKRYSGCMNAYSTIARQEGVRGLWKGMLPNIARNAIINAAELVSYDMIKESILKHELMTDNMPCHFTSAFGAGFIATVVASPVDVVKTRYMNSEPGTYTGAVNCAVKMYQTNGAMGFYKGFMPSFVRLGSWNIVMFVTFEQLKRVFQRVQDNGIPKPIPRDVPKGQF